MARSASPGSTLWMAVVPVSGINRRRARIAHALTALLVCGLIWRIARYAINPALWGDEAFAANNLLTHGVAGLLGPLDYFQVVPIGFLAIEKVVAGVLGYSEWSLRLVPFLAGVASLVLFERWARTLVDRRSALIAVGIFAASFYPARHATEIKPYAIDLLASLATMMLAWRISRDRDAPGAWLALIGVVAVGLWFSYPLVFVAAGAGMFLAAVILRAPTPRGLALWSAYGLATGSSWLAMFLWVGRVQSRAASIYAGDQHWGPAFPPLSEPGSMPFWLLDVHCGNMMAYPVGGNHFGSAATFLLVMVGCARLWKFRPSLLFLLLSPLLPTFLAAAAHRYPYGTSARVSLYMAPAFCLLAGVGLVDLIRRIVPVRKRGRYLHFFAILLLLGIGGATVVNVAAPYKNQEDAANRERVRELAGLSLPGETWLVFDGMEGRPPRDDVMRKHWTQQLAEVRFHLMTLASGPVRWISETTGLPISDGGRTWLIVHRNGFPGFDERQFAIYLARLTDQRGRPVVHPGPLGRGESIDAYEFPAR